MRKIRKRSGYPTVNFIAACEDYCKDTGKKEVRLADFLDWLKRKEKKGERIMSEKKTMTRAEKLDALKYLLEASRNAARLICENCAYIDFCFNMKRFIIEKQWKKYV